MASKQLEKVDKHLNKLGQFGQPYNMRGKKITKKRWNEFLRVLKEETLGIIVATCEKTGIGQTTYYDHRLEDEEFAEESDKVMRQIGTPFTEDRLREAIFHREGWAIKFYLQCVSKKWRPYEKREISGKLSADIEQKISTDPILKKAVKFYEEQLKKDYRGKDDSGKHAGLDKKRGNKKRKRRAN